MITAVSCAVPNRGPNDPKLVGQSRIQVLAGTRLAEIMGAGGHDEGFFCNYEVNAEFWPRFEAAGLKAAALGPQQEIRAVELPEHPFYIASLFQPQLTSKVTGRPHPLVQAYLRAAAAGRRAVA